MIIKTTNLSKIYKQGENSIKALHRCDFTANKGESIAVVGPSGSGKSTLLHLIGLLDEPSGGEIFIDGDATSIMNAAKRAEIRRKKIGFVFQSFNLLPMLTAKENILMPLLLDGKKVDDKLFNRLVELLGISDRLRHFPSQMSGGQQQRVAIARALINSPDIILADEPTGALDSKTSSEIIDALINLNENGNTLIVVTHDKKIADRCGRIVTIKDGVLS